MIEEDFEEEFEEDLFYVEIKSIKRSTPKAVLIELKDGSEEWFPKSQMSKYNGIGFIIPLWLAEEKGL